MIIKFQLKNIEGITTLLNREINGVHDPMKIEEYPQFSALKKDLDFIQLVETWEKKMLPSKFKLEKDVFISLDLDGKDLEVWLENEDGQKAKIDPINNEIVVKERRFTL